MDKPFSDPEELEHRAQDVPRGFPFLASVAEAAIHGRKFAYRRQFEVGETRVVQVWTLAARERTLPGRWDQTVYDKLLAYRQEVGAQDDGAHFSFAMEDFADFVFGERGDRVCEVLLESLHTIQSQVVDLEVWIDGELILESFSSVLAGVSTARRMLDAGGYEAFDVEVRFWPDLWAPV